MGYAEELGPDDPERRESASFPFPSLMPSVSLGPEAVKGMIVADIEAVEREHRPMIGNTTCLASSCDMWPCAPARTAQWLRRLIGA